MTNGRRATDGRRALGPAAAVVGLLLFGAVLLLIPARSVPAPGAVAEIVVGESAGPTATVVEDPPTGTTVPEVVPRPPRSSGTTTTSTRTSTTRARTMADHTVGPLAAVTRPVDTLLGRPRVADPDLVAPARPARPARSGGVPRPAWSSWDGCWR